MARTEPVLHFLAVETAKWTFALPVPQIARITRESDLTTQKSTQGTTGIMVADQAIAVLDIGAWLSGTSEGSSGDLIVQLKAPHEKFAIRVDRALEVFGAQKSELRPAPQGLFLVERALPVLGFSPWSKLTASLLRGALSANNLALSRLAALGPIRRDKEQLFAGRHLLNGHKKLVDEVSATTSFGCAIFQGNVQIATTATRAGSQVRAIGAKANDDITESVLRRGREFRGLTHTIGKEWAIVYRPLLDASHHIAGMVATYREVSSRLFPVFDASGVVLAMNAGAGPASV